MLAVILLLSYNWHTIQLYIFKVYNLMFWQCIYLQNRHHNQDNKPIHHLQIGTAWISRTDKLEGYYLTSKGIL